MTRWNWVWVVFAIFMMWLNYGNTEWLDQFEVGIIGFIVIVAVVVGIAKKSENS